MLNQLLRFTLVSGALLWLKPRWRGLLALASFVLLVHVLHGEYLDYVALSDNDQYLVPSYLLKWVALLAGVGVYFLAVLSSSGQDTRKRKGKRGKGRDKSGTSPNNAAVRSPDDSLETLAGKDDGFDFLRNKKSLESRAEKLLHSTRKK